MRFKIFGISLLILMLGTALLAYSVTSSGFQLSVASNSSTGGAFIGADCTITGVTSSTTASSFGEAAIITFQGHITVKSVCTESLSDWPIYYWTYTNGARSNPSYLSVFTTNSVGDFSFQVQAPSLISNNFTVVSSICENISPPCSFDAITQASSIVKLSVTGTQPTTYGQLTYVDANTLQPVPNLVVLIAQQSNNQQVCQTQTGSNGEAICQSLTAQTYTWSYSDPASNGAYGTPNTGTFTVTGSPPTPYTATIKISPVIFNQLEFLDAGTNSPLPGLAISTQGESGNCNGVTNSQGIVICNSLVPGTPYTWSFSQTNNYGYPTTGQFTPSNTPLTFKALIAHNTEIRAVSVTTGAALAGIILTSTGPAQCQSTTNSTGWANCAIPTGTYRFTFTDPTGRYSKYVSALTQVTLLSVFTVSMTPSQQAILVIDSVTLAGIQGIDLNVKNSQNAIVCTGITNATGYMLCTSGIPIADYTISGSDSQSHRYSAFGNISWNASALITIGLVLPGGNGGGGGGGSGLNGASIVQGFSLILVIFGALGTIGGAVIPSGTKVR